MRKLMDWLLGRKQPVKRDWHRIHQIHLLMADFMRASIELMGEPCMTISYNALDEFAPYSLVWIAGMQCPSGVVPGEHTEQQIIEFTAFWRRGAAARKGIQSKGD